MISAYLDRVEGERAVLVLADGQKITLPAALLPAGTNEGDFLHLAIGRDETATAAAKAEALSLRREIE